MLVQLLFRKEGNARFLSHLDLVAMLEYAVRRSGLPVELSQGFNPRPRMSLAAALPLGYVGEREILDMQLREDLPPQEVAARLQTALPAGLTILSAAVLPAGTKPSGSRLRSARYRILLPNPVPDLRLRVDELLARTEILIEEAREGGKRIRNLRDWVIRLEAADDRTLTLETELHGEGGVRPEQYVQAMDLPLEGVRITREELVLAQ